MNKNEHYKCSKILQSVLKRPISQIFWSYGGKCADETPFTLSLVSEKLERCLYHSLDDFIKDMKLSIDPSSSFCKKDPLRSAAVSLLNKDLEEAIQKYSVSISKHIQETQLIEKSLIEFVEESSHFCNTTIEICESHDPASRMTQIREKEYSSSDIAIMLQSVRSPELVLRFASRAFKLQPETITVGNDLSFHFALMTNETIQDLGVFITNTLRSVAQGSIDTIRVVDRPE